jgi:Cu(I)/Ag(I) efflux system membrane fusion protein
MFNKKIVATAIVMLLIGGGTGYWISVATLSQPEKAAAPIERKPLFYRNPMNPEITSPTPAKDEMGMDYIPVYPDDNTQAAAPAGMVKIDPTVVQDIGVRTAKAGRTVLSRHVRTVGRVALDEERVARLHPKYDGWVQKLFIGATGEKVKKNTMLLSIYSPQVVATEDEYLLALANEKKLKQSPFADVREGAESLLRSTRERLQLLDMPAHQLRQLTRTRKAIHAVHIHSPFEGVVMSIGAREGARITPNTELYVIADLSRIWVLADLYQDDLPWVHVGDTAEMQVSGIPGRTFTGKVSFIYPYFEAKTRTVKVRIEFNNPGLLLKPEMYANVDILADKQVNAIVVPSAAIVRSGTGAQVFVERAPGKFEPRNVTLGVASDGKTQILSGLQDGETVVTSSQFMIDSESKLREATAKMLEPQQAVPQAPETKPEMSGLQQKPASSSRHDMPNMHHDGKMQMESQP